MLKIVFKELRYFQWIKNIIIFAPLIFSGQFFQIDKVFTSVLGFIVFCLYSSSIYIINDLTDINKDKLHPIKKNRPIAAGLISIPFAFIILFIVLCIAIIIQIQLNINFNIIAICYFLLMFLYSFYLKNIFIADVIVIAGGFILRAVAGAEIISVEISYWLIICTFFLAMLIGFGKRRSELINLGNKAVNFKKTLAFYSVELIDKFLLIITSSILISYVLYAFDSRTIDKLSGNMKYSIPFVIYGILRYLYLITNNQLTETPEIIVLKDKATLINFILWILSIIIILYLN